MADAKSGKGGFKEFAQHENGSADKAVPVGPSQGTKPAPIVSPPATRPDIGPATRAEKSLPHTFDDKKPSGRR